ncbi:MAG: hypothetical protein HRU17_03005 [Polyangiaceae bacterium]|nr:hypothetical protein [Polyangiaceae bacterium]
MHRYSKSLALLAFPLLAGVACGEAKDARLPELRGEVVKATAVLAEDTTEEDREKFVVDDAVGPTTGAVITQEEVVETAGCGDPSIDISGYPTCGSDGVCAPADSLNAQSKEMLPAAGLEGCGASEICAPSYIAQTGGEFRYRKCDSLGGFEGRCIPDYSPIIGNFADWLPAAGCDDPGHLCMPCYHPTIPDSPTGVCGLGCDDPGPTFEQGAMATCCGDVGVCPPSDILPPALVDALPSCPAENTTCVPRKLFDELMVRAESSDKPQLDTCSTDILGNRGNPGRCVHGECFVSGMTESTSQYNGIKQADCPSGEKCVPCENKGEETGICNPI